jgi:prepilin-type N-terminal cleavage/methylation domain-containing protein
MVTGASSMDRGRRSRQAAFSLLEMLVVMAVLAVTFGFASFAVRPSSAQVYATSLRNLVLQSRFEAIRRNEPVVVGWDASAREFVVRTAGATDWCDGSGSELRRSNAADVGRLAITTTVTGSASLVWVPSGQARTCARASFPEAFAAIDDGRSVRRLVIAAAGRVEVR